MTTPNFEIPELAAAQAQKYVTVNEALRVVDTAMNLTVLQMDLTTPPGTPAEGAKYIPLATATGAWTGKENDIAVFINAEWIFFTPAEGWRAYDQDTDTFLLWNGTAWVSLLASGSSEVLAQGSFGSALNMKIIEEELTGLSGATAVTTAAFPDQCIVLGVSLRVTTSITGATSFDCGDGTTVDRFGSTLGLSGGVTNQGTAGPTGNYTSTTVTLTANGSNFSAGAVRVSLMYIELIAPTS